MLLSAMRGVMQPARQRAGSDDDYALVGLQLEASKNLAV